MAFEPEPGLVYLAEVLHDQAVALDAVLLLAKYAESFRVHSKVRVHLPLEVHDRSLEYTSYFFLLLSELGGVNNKL